MFTVLRDLDYNEVAEDICTQVNSANMNCEKEKTEFGEINNQIYNGVKLMLAVLNFPNWKKQLTSST